MSEIIEQIDGIEYNWSPSRFAITNDDFLKKCSELYSNHYGIWGEEGFNPGKRIKLSPGKLNEWLDNDDTYIYFASVDEKLIGYAIALIKTTYGKKNITWVTQLVVHTDYRNKGIAKNLLFSIWGFSDPFAWGIVSANPYAIRALEKATRRRAYPTEIKKHKKRLHNLGHSSVPFIKDDTVECITEKESTINTKFYVSHNDTEEMIENVTKDGVPWTLGSLKDGWEWFAFTFQNQEQLSLTAKEIEDMVSTADSVVKNAYTRMDLSSGRHVFSKNTKSEIDYILANTNLKEDSIIYDLGCGVGRHSLEFGLRNYNVVAVDYIQSNIDKLSDEIKKLGLTNVDTKVEDCRILRSERKADLVICLYDVIGSYAELDDNIKIMQTAYDLLVTDGYFVLSVMNYESTVNNAKYKFEFSKNADAILNLPSSFIMEQTGDVFNPDYYLVDTETHLVYRREKFKERAGLPVELVVRDRRFSIDEIRSLLESVGFSVEDIKCTNATGWNKSYDKNSKRAKEILVIASKKPESEQ